jgi:hypothetical protein
VPRADLAIAAGDVDDYIESPALWLAGQIRPHMQVTLVQGNRHYQGGAFRGSRDLARRCPAELDPAR